MMSENQKYITLVNGMQVEKPAVTSSAGAADAGKIVATGVDGKLDATLIPSSVTNHTSDKYLHKQSTGCTQIGINANVEGLGNYIFLSNYFPSITAYDDTEKTITVSSAYSITVGASLMLFSHLTTPLETTICTVVSISGTVITIESNATTLAPYKYAAVYSDDSTSDTCGTHAEGKETVCVGISSHAEGHNSKAVGVNSHAEGNQTIANGGYTHAEGSGSVASGVVSHAEGFGTTANGQCSHAEGRQSTANSIGSHAEGYGSVASGNYSHAEGYGSVASGTDSHAEGSGSIASGTISHAEGYRSSSDAYASHAEGCYNKALSGSPTSYTATADAFVIGNGTYKYTDGKGITTLSNAFRVTFDGQTYGLSAFNSTGADYAEYFEWADENSNKEDRVGYFVTLDGEKIKKAVASDAYILGVVSVNPSVIGDSFQDDWNGKYVTDDWGRIQYHYVDVLEVKDEDGNIITPAHQDYVPQYNPDWDSSKEYIPREKRPEWSPVGMMGKLLVRDDGTCEVNGYCKSNDNGIATKADIGYRVVKRINSNMIQVLLK